MARKPKSFRPPPIAMGALRCRVVRGPHAEDVGLEPNEARWYWRTFRGETCVEVVGWATTDEVKRRAAGHVVSGLDEAPVSALTGTLGAVIDAYLAATLARGDLALNTKRNAKRNLGHVRDGMGGLRCRDVDQAEVRAYVNERIEQGAASSTIRQEQGAVAAAWAWGHADRRAMTPRIAFPSVKVEEMEERQRDKYTPPDEDVEAVIASLPMGWQRMTIYLAFETGMRLHEIAALRWQHVTFGEGQGVIAVPPETKTGARDVAVDEHVLEALRAWRELPPVSTEAAQVGYLLGCLPGNVSSKVGGFEGGSIGDACAALGLRTFTPHGLRRAVVRRFRRAGVPVKVAADHFGHSPAMMMSMYDEVDEQDRANALDLLRAHRKGRKPKKPRLSVVSK